MSENLFNSSFLLRSKKNLLQATREILRSKGVKLRKRLSQNLSVNPSYLKCFLHAASSTKYTELIEIGTGIGVLTLVLAENLSDRTIISIEKDKLLFSIASETLGKLDNVALVLGDGLKLITTTTVPLVVSSLPFHLTSSFIVSIARNNNIEKAILGIQKEVAQRLTASPGSPDYGRLTILTSLLFTVKILSSFPPSSFYPPPKVSVSVIELTRKRKYDARVHGCLERLSACLFSQRNKLAHKVLKKCIKEEVGAEKCIGRLPENARVRDLSPEVLECIAQEIVSCSSTNP